MVKTRLSRGHGHATAREPLCRPHRPTAVFTAHDVRVPGLTRPRVSRAHASRTAPASSV
ncbi:hypothetical protein RND61_18525 [Streptomyces sp. TRM76323]|uniref:Uncharacterized protein n=1 Tax=Streptomyces tamarix TaxID=3078565 RepID=A0ABU3QMR9_9ACTN|nr:hypothetical protein [Streptomyces tamarix]MDT9684039.1 hypothetical protein [Streptomyces tamarix]